MVQNLLQSFSEFGHVGVVTGFELWTVPISHSLMALNRNPDSDAQILVMVVFRLVLLPLLFLNVGAHTASVQVSRWSPNRWCRDDSFSRFLSGKGLFLIRSWTSSVKLRPLFLARLLNLSSSCDDSRILSWLSLGWCFFMAGVSQIEIMTPL